MEVKVTGTAAKTAIVGACLAVIMLTFLKSKGTPHPVMLYIRDQQTITHLLVLHILRAKNIFLFYFIF